MSPRHRRALLLVLPAALAVSVLPSEAPYADMLFRGGPAVLRTNLALAALLPYFAVFPLALGVLFLPRPPKTSALASPDVAVLRFFGGAGLLTWLGFVLGALNLLRPLVCVPIFLAVLYRWLLDASWSRPSLEPSVRAPVLAVRLGIALILLVVLLTKGILVNLYTSDVIQLYFPYLAEIRHAHGIWLDPGRPVISDFLIGRGNGVHLFFAAFTNQFIAPPLSLLYLAAIALIAHRMVDRFVPSSWPPARRLLPECAALLAVCSPLLKMEFGKYHMQAGAFFLLLSWGSLLFLFTDDAESGWLYRMLLPVALAVPLTLPQYQALAFVLLAISAAATAASRGPRAALPHGLLFAWGCAATAMSLAFNWLYVGIGEINPASLFLRFADIGRLQRWTSVDLIQYLAFCQGIALARPRPSFELLIQALRALARLFFPWPVSQARLLPAFAFLVLSYVAVALIRRPRTPPSLAPRAGIFIPALFSLYFAGWLTSAALNQGSLARVMEFQAVYGPVALAAAIALFVAFEPGILRVRAAGFGLAAACLLLAACNVYRLDGGSPMDGSWKNGGWKSSIGRAARYFASREGLVSANGALEHYGVKGQWDFERCRELGRLLPGRELILPLNAVFAIVPCQNSPLLPRYKLIHHYESVLSPHYRAALLGTPEEAYAVYRKLGIDYFYVAKDDIYFWGPGYGDGFNFANLLRHFDVYREESGFVLLTWRGMGERPVSPALAARIEALRESARTTPGISSYWRGIEALRAWSDSGRPM